MGRTDPAATAVPTLIVLALVTAGAAWGATLIEPEVDFVDTVPDHPGLAPYRALLDELDGVRFLAIYQAHDNASGTDSLRSEAFDALVLEQQGFSADLRAAFPDAFGHELSVVEAMRQGHYMFQKIATSGNPPESAYSVPDNQLVYDQVKADLLEGDTLDGVLAPGGESALSLFFIHTRDEAAARNLVLDVADWLGDWTTVHSNHPVTTDHQPTGLVWASAYTDTINQQDMRLWVPVAAAAVAIVLLWIVRGPTNVAIATVGLGAALIWTFGLMGILGIRISFLTVFLAPVVVGIGIDYAVHILHRYEEERGNGASRVDALRTAARRTGTAVRITAFTTVAALLWMGTVSAPLFAEIGRVAALGVALGFISSVLLVPALRAVIPDRDHTPRRDRIGPLLARAARIPPAASILLLLLIASTAAWGAVQHTTVESGSQENEFPADDPVLALQHRLEAEYGAFQRAYIVVQGDMARADALHAMHAAVQDAADLPLYRDASSVTDLLLADEATDEGAVDILGSVLANSTGEQPTEQERLPQTDEEARDALASLWDDPLWRSIVPFTINRDLDLAVVAIQIDPWQDQTELRGLADALLVKAERFQEAMGPSYQVAAAGAPLNRAEVIEQTMPDVARIVFGTALVVFVALAISWFRRPRGLLAALGGAAIVLIAGLVMLAGVPALDAIYATSGGGNSATLTHMFLLAFAVVVGIGVDDLVHVAERAWAAGSLREGFLGAGRAITGTTATTFAAFAVMGGVYFLQSKNLAILTAAGVLVVYVLAVLMAPAVIRPGTTGRRSARP